MKNCFLRLFYDEIAKCSVHSNIFVKPKQYVSCLLVLWCFSPWFCKFSRLVCSVKCLYVEPGPGGICVLHAEDLRRGV